MAETRVSGRISGLSPELRSILRDLRRELEAIYGDRLVRMVLYGSQARGDAQPGSDIDVLVVLRGEVQPYREIVRTERAVADVSLDHAACVCCMFVSASDFTSRESPLLLNVRREGIAV